MQFARLTQVFRTKRIWASAAMLGSALLLTGCESTSMSRTDKGVVGGGLAGAGVGALVGKATGNTAAGAAIGGVLGAVGGGLTGNAMDNAERRGEQRGIAAANAANAAAQPTNPLSVEDVGALAKRGLTDSLIVTQIRTTNSTYNLSSNQIVYLKDCGVSDQVINEMQLTQQRNGSMGYRSHAPGGTQVGYHPR